MSESARALGASDRPLVDAYDCAMLDLDGVIYIGPDAVDGVPTLLRSVRERGMKLAFVTNNASRTPDAVAKHLRDLGVEAEAADVVTSAQATARELATRLEPGSAVLVVGGEGLHVALRAEGLLPVDSRGDDPVAVAQGFDRSVGWVQLAEATAVIRDGALWAAANLDLTVPTKLGLAPGNGALVNAVAEAVGFRPAFVAGKPFRPLFDETVRRVASQCPVVVGDRLDTDIEGANACDVDSLLVMTGVTDLSELCAAPAQHRPTYVSWTLRGLLDRHPAPSRQGEVHELNGWRAHVDDSRVLVDGRGDDRDDGLRVVVSAAWAWADAGDGRGRVEIDPEVV